MHGKAEIPDILQPAGAPVDVILPDASRIFLDRARRFTALAEGHPLADWLSFLGRLTEAQHELLHDDPPASLRPAPSPAPPPGWRGPLLALTRRLASAAPGPARAVLEEIQAMDGATLDALAVKVLGMELDGPAARYLPFIFAALQLHWTAAAARSDRAGIKASADPRRCPVCGHLPVAGIVRTDGEAPNRRYLHCALCNTEWHLVRVTCAACGDGGQIAYYHIEGKDEGVRAETCGACGGYLKIVYREKSPGADPVADDLATLGLDLLVQEAGYSRFGPNLLFAAT